MTVISKEKVKDMYYASLMYEYHRVTEKIRLFEKKYGMLFSEFEKRVKDSGKEDFEKWDDYMEWKGYEKVLHELKKEKKELEVGDYKIS
jgi:phosphatidylserine/phosphatidylglycerophosphate/cardiolipin synthase-like enzyme